MDTHKKKEKADQYQKLIHEMSETIGAYKHRNRKYEQELNYQLNQLKSSLDELSTDARKDQPNQLGNIIDTNIEELEKLSELRESVTGLQTGFFDLDEITSGLQKPDLIILGARPGMGKTALAQNITEHIATQRKNPSAVLWFSLEMAKEQLSKRILISSSKIDSASFRTGRLEVEDWDKLAFMVDRLSSAPIFIKDDSDVSIQQIISESRSLNAELENGLSLIVVDYLQIVKSSNSNQPRDEEIDEVAFSLKKLAVELNIPVIAISQLNRNLENRIDKRPRLSDLRGSGSIEVHADLVIFIYRDEVYWEDSKDKGKAELILAKHRNGALGTINLAFIGKYLKFANYSLREEASDNIPF